MNKNIRNVLASGAIASALALSTGLGSAHVFADTTTGSASSPTTVQGTASSTTNGTTANGATSASGTTSGSDTTTTSGTASGSGTATTSGTASTSGTTSGSGTTSTGGTTSTSGTTSGSGTTSTGGTTSTSGTTTASGTTSTDGTGSTAAGTGGTSASGTTTAAGATQPTITETPALVPGNFFYFLKTITEKIELALTFNDTDKAKRLAELAQERLAEAQELMKAGKTDLAQKTLQDALDQQKQAEDTAGSSKPASSQTNNPAAPSTNELIAQLQAKFGQDILALQAALDKVQNPQAKAELAKNIAKAQDHLDKKIAEILAKQNAAVQSDKNQKETDGQEGDDQDKSKTNEKDENQTQQAAQTQSLAQTQPGAPLQPVAQTQPAPLQPVTQTQPVASSQPVTQTQHKETHAEQDTHSQPEVTHDHHEAEDRTASTATHTHQDAEKEAEQINRQAAASVQQAPVKVEVKGDEESHQRIHAVVKVTEQQRENHQGQNENGDNQGSDHGNHNED